MLYWKWLTSTVWPFLYSFMKADANKHKPYTITNKNKKNNNKKQRTENEWKKQNICAYTYTPAERGRGESKRDRVKKGIKFNTISCTSAVFLSPYVMIVGRCFDIQRAVMLALYCCRGNYDELFYIGWYLHVALYFHWRTFSSSIYFLLSCSFFHSFFLLLLLLYNFL